MEPETLVVHLAPRGPRRRPRTAEQEERYQWLLHLRTSSPELFQLEMDRMDEISRLITQKKPLQLPSPEIRQQLEAARLERNGPACLYVSPLFVTDPSEDTCATKDEDDMYKKLANLDPRKSVFKIANHVTGVVYEELTARMIKRYREDPGESRVDTCGITDEVREGISVLTITN